MPPKILEVRDLTGGRNGADDPLSLPDDQAVEMLNVDHYEGRFARKRNGSTAVTETGGTAFTGGMASIFRHVPGAAETSAEFWGTDLTAGLTKRMAGGTTFADVTFDDAIQDRPQDMVGVSFNGKLFLAYNSSVDRLHCWDPNLGTPRVRRVGINAGTTGPTVANTGAGAYAAVIRYYRVRFYQSIVQDLSPLSEPTNSVSFTPSGAGTAARVTKPSNPGEGETHWILEASADNTTFYWLSTMVIATTTYDDTGAPSAYSSGALQLSPQAGMFSLPPSAKFLLTDGNRLIMAGNHESGKTSRVLFTPVLGSADRGDDERVPNQTNQKNWVDLNENDGGAITGLGGPIFGAPYAFKYRQVWKLNPTGDVSVPYLPRKLADGVYGAIHHKTIVVAKDRGGDPALYALGPEGPHRIVIVQGRATPQYLGRDIEDIWSTINLAASTVVAHGIYHADKHQVWWWIATGLSNEPDTKIVFDVLLGRFVEGDRVRGGWYKHTGDTAAARCSVMMSNTLGATMSRDLKPYIGRASASILQKCDSGNTHDANTNFQAYVITKPLPIAALGTKVGLGQSTLVAKVSSGVTITQTLTRDFGLESRTSSVTLTASASETRVVKKFEGSDMAQADTIQLQIGDSAAAANAWTLDAWSAPVHSEGPK